jgi:hypothetical protein
MMRRFASINDLPIKEAERKFFWPLGRRPAAGRTSGAERSQPVTSSTAMLRTHERGQVVFKSILPDDLEWKAFAAFPPAVRLAVLIGEPSQPGPT